jgi:putative NIF3 family GTP cyclohydrolase 1 type 2
VNLNDVCAELDAFFRIHALGPDLPFSRLMPAVYRDAGIGLEAHFAPAFLRRFHGLMIRAGNSVERIYCAVFCSDEIVAKVLDRGAHDALLICHHPLVMETSDRGFLPLSLASLAAVQEIGLSVYVLHTPLDVHEAVSPSRALARALGLARLEPWSEGPEGTVAVHGRLPAPIHFDTLLARVRDVTGVPMLHSVRNHRSVQTVAVLGGGTDVSGIQEAEALGCDVLVTGTYWNQVQTEIGSWYRREFEAIRDSLRISLIECSHYASEAVVMREDLIELCSSRFGLPCEFVSQDDPWY